MIESLIQQAPLFDTLPDSEIKHLARSLSSVEFPEGKTLIREGRSDDRFFVLLDGQVEIIKSLDTTDERILGVRGRGSFLGEMSLFSPDRHHTATVRALTPVKLLEITRADFNALLHRQPELAYGMVRMLSRRLEQSENLTILDLQEKNLQLTEAYEELRAAQEQIIEKEKLEHELNLARQIQLTILPNELPKSPDFEYGAKMIPARAVGGDFYDLIALGGDRMGIVVGDVCDKGVPSALLMAVTYSLVRAEAYRAVSPAEAVLTANRHLVEMDVAPMFVTLLYGILDFSTREFSYVRAGHPHPLVLDEYNQPITLDSTRGQPLGLFDDILLDEQSVVIPQGGTVLVFSDGITEAGNEAGDFFGIEQLLHALPPSTQATAQEVCDTLWLAVERFSVPFAQQDDFTLVCVKSI